MSRDPMIPRGPLKEYEPGWCPYCGEPEQVCGGKCGLNDYPDWLDDDDDPRTVDEICEPPLPHERQP